MKGHGCASCRVQHDKDDTDPDCDKCHRTRIGLMPENQEAWAFFEEIQFWSGGGFLKNGIFDPGNRAEGLDLFLKFRTIQLTELQQDEIYWKLKIIYSTINQVNSEKLEDMK